MPADFHRSFRQRQEIITGPGRGTVRTPFVDMFVDETIIPLQGNSGFFGAEFQGPTQEKLSPFMLVDFNYSVVSSIGVGNQVAITILDPNWDVLGDIVANALSNKSSIGFQFGWRGLDDRFGRNVHGLFIHDYNVSYNSFQGATIQLIAVDRTIQLSQVSKSIAFKANTPISDVIKQIFNIIDPSIEVEIDPIKQVLGEEYRWMNNLSPLEYLKEILRVAKSVKGTSNYIMLTELDETGRTKVKIKADNAHSTVVRKYFMGRDRAGQMIEFSPQVLGSVLLTMGGGRADAVSVDPKTGSAQKVTSTQEENKTGLADKAVLETPKKPTKTHEVPVSDKDSAEGVASEARSRVDNHMNNATAVVWGDPNIKAFDQIDVVVLKSDVPGVVKDISDKYIVRTSGTYVVKSVEHIIQAGLFRTMLELYRESSFVGNGPAQLRLPTSLRTKANEEVVTVPKVIDSKFG